MKKLYLLIVLFFISLQTNFCQSFDFAAKIGGNEDDTVRDIVIDTNGDIYIVGQFRDTVDFNFGPGVANRTSNGLGDVFLLKIDQNHDFLWVNTFGGTGNDNATTVTIDDSGQILVGGYFLNTVDFNPDPSFTTNRTSNGGEDSFVVKFFTNGVFNGVTTFGGTSRDRLTDVKVNYNNDYFITGFFRNTVDFDPGAGVTNLTAGSTDGDAYVAHLSQSLGLVWVRQFEVTSSGASDVSRTNAMAIDLNNNIITAGNFTGTVDFDPGVGIQSLSASDNKAMFISKLDSLGNFVFAKLMDSDDPGTGSGFGVGVERIKDLITDSNDNLIAVGRFNGTCDFDPGPGTSNLSTPFSGTNSKYNSFILKLNSTGDFVWVKQLRTPLSQFTAYNDINAVQVDNGDNIYISGPMDGLTDFDPSSSATLNNGNSSSFSVKLDNAGNLVWAAPSNEPSGFLDIQESFLKGSKLCIVGNFQGGFIDFDPGSAQFNLNSTGGNSIEDGFIQILMENTLSNDDFFNNHDIKIFPNPTNQFILVNGLEEFNYEVTTLQGKKLLEGSYTSGLDKIDVSSLSIGIYIISISNQDGSQNMTHKILKQ